MIAPRFAHRQALVALIWVVGLAACHSAQESSHRLTLLARLHDARPAGRIMAIRELSRDMNREEMTAIARSAKEAPEDVRAEVAKALGKSAEPEAIELLGAILLDRSDYVRAAAVRELLQKQGERAAGYVVNAYQGDWPLTRQAVSEAPAAIFRRAVAIEALEWRRQMEDRRTDSHPEIRAQALADVGRDATLPIVAELSARLVDTQPAMAAAAAAGLVNARATDQVPALIQALHYPADLVVDAAAVALGEMNAPAAVEPLAVTLEKAQGDVANHILDALETMPLTDAARAAVCRVATGHSDAYIALRAARLVGASCTIPITLPPGSADAAARLLVLAALDRKDPVLLRRARQLLDDPDAHVAASAAVYLGRCGTEADGAALLKHSQDALLSLQKGRAIHAEQLRAARPAPPSPEIQAVQAFQRAMLAGNGGKQPPDPTIPNKLAQMIARRQSTAITPFEDRPGAIDFIATTSAAAAHLGASVDELAATLLSDSEPSIRLIAADLGDLAGAQGEALRMRLTADPDAEVRLRSAILDFQAHRPGALETLAALAPSSDPDSRASIAKSIAAEPEKAKALLISIAEGGDFAEPIAIHALAKLPGADIDRVLVERLEDTNRVGAYAAIEALRSRPGAAIDAALVGAAVNPSPDLREAAMDVLVTRKACSVAARLTPLELDYSGAVRASVAALRRSCGAP